MSHQAVVWDRPRDKALYPDLPTQGMVERCEKTQGSSTERLVQQCWKLGFFEHQVPAPAFCQFWSFAYAPRSVWPCSPKESQINLCLPEAKILPFSETKKISLKTTAHTHVSSLSGKKTSVDECNKNFTYPSSMVCFVMEHKSSLFWC